MFLYKISPLHIYNPRTSGQQTVNSRYINSLPWDQQEIQDFLRPKVPNCMTPKTNLRSITLHRAATKFLGNLT